MNLSRYDIYITQNDSFMTIHAILYDISSEVLQFNSATYRVSSSDSISNIINAIFAYEDEYDCKLIDDNGIRLGYQGLNHGCTNIYVDKKLVSAKQCKQYKWIAVTSLDLRLMVNGIEQIYDSLSVLFVNLDYANLSINGTNFKWKKSCQSADEIINAIFSQNGKVFWKDNIVKESIVDYIYYMFRHKLCEKEKYFPSDLERVFLMSSFVYKLPPSKKKKINQILARNGVIVVGGYLTKFMTDEEIILSIVDGLGVENDVTIIIDRYDFWQSPLWVKPTVISPMIKHSQISSYFYMHVGNTIKEGKILAHGELQYVSKKEKFFILGDRINLVNIFDIKKVEAEMDNPSHVEISSQDLSQRMLSTKNVRRIIIDTRHMPVVYGPKWNFNKDRLDNWIYSIDEVD